MARKMSISYDVENGTVTFTPSDTSVEGITLSIHDYPQPIVTHNAVFGVGTVGQNAYAGIDEPKAMIEAIRQRDTAMKAGDWKARGEGGGAKSTMLAQDIVTATGNDLAAVIAFLVDKTKEEKTALRNDPGVSVARAAREKAAAAKAEKAAKAKASESDGSGDLFEGLAG